MDFLLPVINEAGTEKGVVRTFTVFVEKALNAPLAADDRRHHTQIPTPKRHGLNFHEELVVGRDDVYGADATSKGDCDMQRMLMFERTTSDIIECCIYKI